MDTAAESTSALPSTSNVAWQETKSGKRILELKEVEENIAKLLHFAGCTLASLHPEPLDTFTKREIEIPTAYEEDEEEAEGKEAERDKSDKQAEFDRFAEAYYVTLNDVQISLRTSIRHLRLSRASPAPLIDPSFGALVNTGGGGGVGVGGYSTSGEGASVASLRLEKEALNDLIRALRGKEK